ncbi:hypothetical protein HBI40_052730 [Parastagonospora nodorum]|nr:hypothetical protein HBH47_122990 [Parastagonospora nodorum]KAH4195799.1 hypothetical protein HBH42_077100 [Parastagonospora nodorum]KAH4968963.1 hypothetical protein HBI78_060610 [Parastagonospora nodorum]KAH5674540.1 hypothetical protein HBI21_135000 [Parastagonospora nodorum]KAH5753131.1 hypothetical protein HBI17_085600 [Parastagonospora nodorum]
MTDTSNGSTPSPSMPTLSATIRIVDSTPRPISHSEDSTWPLRSRVGDSSSDSTPTRPRANTYDPHTPERKRDTDADSVVSFTPSTSSKRLANWVSGLLGR